MEKKFYGIFRITCAGKKDEAARKAELIRTALTCSSFFKPDRLPYTLRARGFTAEKEELSRLYRAQKEQVQREELTRRGGVYHTVLWKHECNEYGYFKPTAQEEKLLN